MSIVVSIRPKPEPQHGRFYWTVETFYRAYYGGIFDEPKYVELVNGELWTKDRISPPHAYITDRITRRLEYLFEPALKLREQKPLHLADDSEPVPDVMLYAGMRMTFGKGTRARMM